jgi:hypothetical protein
MAGTPHTPGTRQPPAGRPSLPAGVARTRHRGLDGPTPVQATRVREDPDAGARKRERLTADHRARHPEGHPECRDPEESEPRRAGSDQQVRQPRHIADELSRAELVGSGGRASYKRGDPQSHARELPLLLGRQHRRGETLEMQRPPEPISRAVEVQSGLDRTEPGIDAAVQHRQRRECSTRLPRITCGFFAARETGQPPGVIPPDHQAGQDCASSPYDRAGKRLRAPVPAFAMITASQLSCRC